MNKPKFRSGTKFIREIPQKTKRIVAVINFKNRIYIATEGGVYFMDNAEKNKLKLLITAKELEKMKLGQILTRTIK